MKNNNKLSKHQQKKQKQLQKQQQKQLRPSLKNKKPKTASSSQQAEQNADFDLNAIEGDNSEQIQIDFLIGQITEDHYHSLKTILVRLGQISKVTNSELADAVVANKAIGNVCLADDQEEEEDDQQEGQDDEDNVYSVLTVLPGSHKTTKKIQEQALKSAQKHSLPSSIINKLSSPQVSLLINERLPNLPPFIVTSAHQVFLKDMSQLKKSNSKLYSDLFSGSILNVSEVQVQNNSTELVKLIFGKFEDYQMCQRAEKWWLGEKNASNKQKSDLRCLYYLIKGEDYFKAVPKLKEYLQ